MRAWLGAALALLCGCPEPPTAVEPVRKQASSAGVAFSRPLPVAGLSLLDAPAKVLAPPTASAVMSVPLEARVVAVKVTPGQHVAAGEPLIDVLMPEVLRAAGQITSASIRLRTYEERRGKVASLLEQGLARASELVELDAQIAAARADREAARAVLRTAQLPDGRAAALLAGDGVLSLRAPMTGTVMAVSARAGEVRTPASGPLVELAAHADALIEARFTSLPPEHVPLRWLGPDGEVALEVRSVAPLANERDGLRTVWLGVAPGQRMPVAGSLGRVQIAAEPDWRALPARSVSSTAEGTFVQLRRGDGVERSAVQVVLRGANEVIVRGLSDDAEIMVTREEEPNP